MAAVYTADCGRLTIATTICLEAPFEALFTGPAKPIEQCSIANSSSKSPSPLLSSS